MNFLKKIIMLVYMLLTLAAGALFLFIALKAYLPTGWASAVDALSENTSYQIALGAIGAIFLAIGLTVPKRLAGKFKRDRVIAFQNPDGEVTVSLSAIEDYIRKIAKNIPSIKDIRPRVDIGKKGIEIITDVSISPAANIPEITERIQAEVKNKVHGMLGVEEKINMQMNIKKIARGQGEAEAPLEAPAAEQVPYREL